MLRGPNRICQVARPPAPPPPLPFQLDASSNAQARDYGVTVIVPVKAGF